MSKNQIVDDSNIINITKECVIDYEPVEKNAFARFIREKMSDYYEIYGSEIKTKELGEMIGIKYEMFRKILNQEKPTKKRDCIIAICVALKLFPGEINEALGLYQYMPALDENNARDGFIIAQVTGSPGITVEELNRRLILRKFPGLDIQNKRGGKKKNLLGDNSEDLPYKVLKMKVRTPIDTDHYYGDPYNSLCTKYDPRNCKCTGDMLLCDSKEKKHIHLVASTDGYLSAQIYKIDDLPVSFMNLDDTGEYKNYFMELINAINLERKRLLNILDDTKNYQQRTSARLIDDFICVFSEKFNYSIPELNEYYVLSRSAGKYCLRVYERSAFMHYYLTPDELKAYYSAEMLEAKETYYSLEEIDALIQKENSRSDERIRLKMRRGAFIKLQSAVDELYQKLKMGSEYIQNLKYIFDNPVETLKFYNLETDFECTYDEEYGEICNSLNEKEYILPNGRVVTITLQDIYKAFEYGFPDIKKICRIKDKYGSIDSVLI